MEFMVSTSEADKLFKKSRAEKQLYDRMLKCGAEKRTQRSEENGKGSSLSATMIQTAGTHAEEIKIESTTDEQENKTD